MWGTLFVLVFLPGYQLGLIVEVKRRASCPELLSRFLYLSASLHTTWCDCKLVPTLADEFLYSCLACHNTSIGLTPPPGMLFSTAWYWLNSTLLNSTCFWSQVFHLPLQLVPADGTHNVAALQESAMTDMIPLVVVADHHNTLKVVHNGVH